MAATLAQRDRLRDIVRDIEGAPRFASPHVRAAHAMFSKAVWDFAAAKIQETLDTDDGFTAHRIIGAWHAHGILGVAWYACDRRDWREDLENVLLTHSPAPSSEKADVPF